MQENNCANNIYVTYDVQLKRYLEASGFNNILYGLHPKSYNMFWVYNRTKELNEVLKKWFCN